MMGMRTAGFRTRVDDPAWSGDTVWKTSIKGAENP
jgi:hypothetical protein